MRIRILKMKVKLLKGLKVLVNSLQYLLKVGIKNVIEKFGLLKTAFVRIKYDV
jgi:hypothetical protein